MDQIDNSRQLGSNYADYLAMLAKSAANLVPYLGPFLAEVLGFTIPNQQMNRLVKFACELNTRIAAVEESIARAHLNDEKFIDLLEEGMRQAARSLSDERRAYIASLIANGMGSADLEFAESKHLLRMLGELSDVEVIWLASYRYQTAGKGEAFFERHRVVLSPVAPYAGGPESDLDKHALQDSYSEHLANLGLLERRYEIETSHFGTKIKVRSYELSWLGRLLLREIGLASEEDL